MVLINEEIDTYIYAIGIFVFFLIFKTIFRNTIIKFLEKITSKTKNNIDTHIVQVIKNPVDYLFIAIGLKISTDFVDFSIKFQNYLDNIINTFFIFILFWTIHRTIYPISIIILKSHEKIKGKELGKDLANFIVKAIQIVIIALGVITILQEWGYNITGFLASLGLVGMAIALAAKDTVANLFGSLVIFSDKPFKIGDWIKTKDVEGIVEVVGIRSTQVRTFAQALVSVPNASLANGAILNWSRMGKRRIKMSVGLTYSTTSEQMKNILKEIRSMLEKHKDIHQETIHIYFTDFQDSSLGIFCYFFTKTTNWGEHMKIQENVNLKIMHIVESNGSSFAFPSRSLYIEKEKDLN